MTAILNEDPPGISQIVPATPPRLLRIVHRCLERNPEQRFQSASDLAFALEALSNSGSSSIVVINQGSCSRWTGALARSSRRARCSFHSLVENPARRPGTSSVPGLLNRAPVPAPKSHPNQRNESVTHLLDEYA